MTITSPLKAIRQNDRVLWGTPSRVPHGSPTLPLETDASVAQLDRAHETSNLRVAGSSPAGSTNLP
jgi:hypothetical protein